MKKLIPLLTLAFGFGTGYGSGNPKWRFRELA
jgi:uncharacterized spore protein YtfJ